MLYFVTISEALTIMETYRNVAAACSQSPFTQTQNRTAWVRGTTYTANPATVTFSQSIAFQTYVYPNLIMTLLTPGDIITQVPLKGFIGTVSPPD
jgi:hypothetical protein